MTCGDEDNVYRVFTGIKNKTSDAYGAMFQGSYEFCRIKTYQNPCVYSVYHYSLHKLSHYLSQELLPPYIDSI